MKDLLKIASKLDSLADMLQASGMERHALNIDVVSNTIEKIAAREGAIRWLDDFSRRNTLQAEYWPQYVKKEIFTGMQNSITGKTGLNPSIFKDISTDSENLVSKELIAILDVKFGNSEKLKLRTDLRDLTKGTRRRIENRMDSSNTFKPVNVPKDIERHLYQEEALKTNPGSIKPVIFIKYKTGLELYEGNHRLIQIILEARKNNQKHFFIEAYVGEPQKPIPSDIGFKDNLKRVLRTLMSKTK